MTVYVLPSPDHDLHGIAKVDYFHGLIDGVAMAQMCPYEDEDSADEEENVSATEMINISKGFTALRITHLQRRWRLRRQILESPPIKKRKKAGEPEAKPMPRKKKKVADEAPPPSASSSEGYRQ